MKLQLLTAVAATALMAVPTLASASDQGWYVRGNVGYGIQTDVDFSRSLVGDVEGEGNVAGSLGLGYAFGNNWRIEVDAAQLWNDLGAVSQAAGTSAKLRTTTGMLNAIYDFDDFGSWQPYVGAGLGIANNKLDAFTTTANTTVCPGFNVTNCRFSDKDSDWSWQLLAGIGYKLSDHLVWDTQYRYQTNFGQAEFTGNGLGGASGAVPIGLEAHADGLGSHALMTGFRYNFGGTTKTVGYAPLPALYTCWDGSTVGSMANCPAQPVTCWDGSTAADQASCPVRTVQCWDGSTVTDAASCPVRSTVVCWDGSIAYDQASCPVQSYEASLCANEYRQEIIYYEFDKPQSAETRDKIQRILDTGRYCSVGNINVVGHTDSSGDARYNQRLSEKRAADVRSELIRQGISSSVITSEGKGETQLFLDTGDGVKEALNRRTEVLIRLNETGVIN